jgi:hypothetical protein
MCWGQTKSGRSNYNYLLIFIIIGYLGVLTSCPVIQTVLAIEYTTHTSELLGISF